jgi:RNA polymerase sigma factor (sigma-70 family)
MHAHLATLPSHLLLAADVRAAASGDTSAFERLVDSTKRAVTAIALSIVRDVRASEDVAQEVYVDAWRDLGTLKNADSFLPWIRQLTRNKALTFVRSRRRYEKRHTAWEADSMEVAARDASTLDRAISEEELAVMAEAIEALPDETREVVTLFYREDHAVKHVAELLGLSEAAVKKRLERARLALKSDMLARFEELSRRTAPGAVFTAGVLSAITIAAPSTAAAATVAGATIAKTVSGAILGAVAGPLIGLAGGAGGLYFGMKRYLDNAIDEEERRALIRYRNKGILVTFGMSVGLPVVALSLSTGHISRGWGAPLVLGMALFFTVVLMRMSLVELPAILARRHELERQRDPEAYARRTAREARGRKIGIAVGLLGACFGIGCGLYALITHP